MPSVSTVASPPTPVQWATPADRQEAARQAYRDSVAAGRPLSGVQLAAMFGRKPRWGVYRIAEVRDAASPIGSTNSAATDRSANPLPIRSNGNAARPNRNGAAEHAQPIGNGRNGSALPIGSNGNGTHRPGPQPHAAANADADADADADATETQRPAHPQPQRRSRTPLDMAITLVVAVVAAAASYGHMLDVALMAGESVWIARAFPITVDGLVLAALRRGADGRGWLALGLGVSIVCNALAQFPGIVAGPVGTVGVAVWPPLSLYGTHRLLSDRRQPRADDDEKQTNTKQEDPTRRSPR